MEPYQFFLASKEPRAQAVGLDPGRPSDDLFDFQQALALWAIRKGRAALFADTGLGKTRMQLEWARQVGAPVLIFAPLAVSEQTIAEGQAVGVDVRYAAEQPTEPGIWITNYERLHRFDPAFWRGVVLDESSILKSVDGKTRTTLLKRWTKVPYRLCATATPAPNDIAELANHAEFLGVMRRPEMLASFFVHDERTWRLKGHAREPFFRWMASWAMYLRAPSDIGFSDDGFVLPPLTIREERLYIDHEPDEVLFPGLAPGIKGRTLARRQSLQARVERAADIIANSEGQWLVWCGLNDEGRRLASLLEDVVLVEGADKPEDKIARERAWRSGDKRTLISKPSMFGFGMNWQHCHQMLFLGLGDSWEQYYQAIRRCWRFGQKQPVEAIIVLSEAEGRVADNIKRKEDQAKTTAAEVVAAVAEIERAELENEGQIPGQLPLPEDAVGEDWRMLAGDCVARVKEIEDGSVGLSVFSPPFAALYTYSAYSEDMGNCRDYEEFFQHFDYLIPELLRVTKPGRRACVHVQQVTMTKATHGEIGWFDFRADVVRHFVKAGWVYDGEVCIDKDPQAQAIRTKSKALLFVQKNKDSSWSRPAMGDYILLFRAPGENPEPIVPDVSNEEWILWARPIWYSIRESETLQYASARSEKDEKHIAPLQLETVERCVRLWSNQGDQVLDPFAGIGTTGYVALQHRRRFVGVELKPEYFNQAVANLPRARAQMSLL